MIAHQGTKYRQVEKSSEVITMECPECGNEQLAKEGTEIYCKSCGVIVERNEIETKENRFYDEEDREKKERSGSSITFTKPDRGINTRIGKGNELNKVNPGKRGQYYRLKKWHRREEGSRRMMKPLRVLQRLINDLNLPRSVFEESARLIEKAQEGGLVKGRKIEGIAGAIVYIVAKNQEVPRTLNEVSDKSGVDKRKLGKTYRYVARELELDIKPTNPKLFLPRYGSELEIDGRTMGKAREILDKAYDKHLFAGNDPRSAVASAIYYADQLVNGTQYEGATLTQKEISAVVGVTEVTLRQNFKRLKENLGEELAPTTSV